MNLEPWGSFLTGLATWFIFYFFHEAITKNNKKHAEETREIYEAWIKNISHNYDETIRELKAKIFLLEKEKHDGTTTTRT